MRKRLVGAVGCAAGLLAAVVWASGVAAADVPAASWTWCGWGGGGFFWVAAFDPTNASTIYLGGDVAGFYKTEDQGLHWRFINRGLQDYGAFGIAVSKSRPATLYGMTTDGIAKSTNGGESWTPLAATRKGAMNLSANKPASVRPVAIDPRDSETVYAGGISGVLGKSTDGGQTWTKLDYLSALDKEPHEAKVVPPAASGKGFLWMGYAAAANDWKNHGRVEKFLSQAGTNWSGYSRVTAAVYAPSNAPKLEAQLVVQSGPNWLWQAGPAMAVKPGAWAELALDLTTIKALDAVHIVYVVLRSGGAAYEGDLAVDAVRLHPADAAASAVALGDWEKPGSVDGWKPGNHTADAPQVKTIRNSADAPVPVVAPIASVAVAESDPSLLLVAHRTLGVFRSADAGATWQRVWSGGGASCVAVFPGDAKRMYGAFEKRGVWVSKDAGVTWSPASAGITNTCSVREVAVDPRRPDVVHAIGLIDWNGSYYRSRDAGATWQCIRHYTRDLSANPTLPDETGSGEFDKRLGGMSKLSNIALSPSNPDVLFLAANWNNMLSADGGTTWTERDRGADITCIHDIQFCGSNTYAAAMDEGLLVSHDQGANWRQIAPRKYTVGLSGHQWRISAVRRGDADRVVSTVFPWTGEPNAVVLSDDQGRFTKVTNGLPAYIPRVNCMWGQSYARALAADPSNPDVLYLGMDGDPEPAKGLMGGGVFKSVDGGKSWAQLPSQPGTRRVFYGLAVDPTEPKRVYWAGFGANGGIYRSEDAGGSWTRLLPSQAYAFNLHVAGNGTVYTGNNDVWRSTDHGQTWKQISNFKTKASLVGIATDPADDKRVWVSLVTWGGEADGGGVYRTTDGGATWQEITGDLGYRKPLILRYNDQTHQLWAGGVGLFRLPQ